MWEDVTRTFHRKKNPECGTNDTCNHKADVIST